MERRSTLPLDGLQVDCIIESSRGGGVEMLQRLIGLGDVPKGDWSSSSAAALVEVGCLFGVTTMLLVFEMLIAYGVLLGLCRKNNNT